VLFTLRRVRFSREKKKKNAELTKSYGESGKMAVLSRATRRIICLTTKVITTSLGIRKGLMASGRHVAFLGDILFYATAKNYDPR